LNKSKAEIFYCLLVIAVASAFFTSCEEKRTPISYELPKNYVGWVTVKYEKKNVPELKSVDGKYLIKISNDGFAETSSRIENGWASDEYYWMDGDKKVVLEQYTEDKKSMIHGEVYVTSGSNDFVNPDTMQIGREYTLFDGSKVTKTDDKNNMSFKSGRPIMYRFYVSRKLEDIWDFSNYHLPPLPKEHEKY